MTWLRLSFASLLIFALAACGGSKDNCGNSTFQAEYEAESKITRASAANVFVVRDEATLSEVSKSFITIDNVVYELEGSSDEANNEEDDSPTVIDLNSLTMRTDGVTIPMARLQARSQRTGDDVYQLDLSQMKAKLQSTFASAGSEHLRVCGVGNPVGTLAVKSDRSTATLQVHLNMTTQVSEEFKAAMKRYGKRAE